MYTKKENILPKEILNLVESELIRRLFILKKKKKILKLLSQICKSVRICSAHVRYGHRNNAEKRCYFHKNLMAATLN